jgi:nucleotide-binding universal stress UspA family protein
MMEFLIDVRSDDADTAHVRFGIELSRRFHARLTGLQVIAIDATVIALPEPLLVLEDEETFAHERHAWWSQMCRARGVDAQWEVRRGVYRRVLMRRASLSDVLIGRLHPIGSGIPFGTGLLARVLMSRVTPMILVPDTSGPSGLRRLTLTWNGSAVSARAIRAALPFIGRARSVTVLAGERDSRGRRDDGDRLVRDLLSRHGIAYRWKELDDCPNPAEAIMDIADETRSDGIVMGAWGRSRLRELALGGTTRHLLAHSRCPLFLSA